MPIVKVEDGSGSSLRVLDVDGYYAPTFDLVVPNQEEEFRNVRNWTGREDDVLICAYPKAGTHWLWEVTSMLVNGSSDRVKLIKETAMLEGVTQAMYNEVKSPRVMNSHLLPRLLPKDVLAKKAKLIFVQRNPKDICVSFFNHHSKILEYEFEGKFEDYVSRFLRGLVDYGSWFDYTLTWERFLRDNPEHPVHVMSYEDMKQDSVKEIKKVSDFLGLKRDDRLIEEIADKCEFSKMKKEKDSMENKAEWKDGQPGMYRKGQVGDWKNWFTVAQNEQFDAVFTDKMRDSSFTYRFS